jgi:hypothetical protein
MTRAKRQGERELRPPKIVSAEEAAIVSAEEAAMMQHARGALKAARGAFVDGDPFQSEVMHAQVTACFGELDTLVPAYAVTIHKSQPRSIQPWSPRS